MAEMEMTTFDHIASAGLHWMINTTAIIALTMELPGVAAIKAPLGRTGPIVLRVDGAQMGCGLTNNLDTGVCTFITKLVSPDGELGKELHHPLPTPDAMEAFFEFIARWAAQGLPTEGDR